MKNVYVTTYIQPIFIEYLNKSQHNMAELIQKHFMDLTTGCLANEPNFYATAADAARTPLGRKITNENKDKYKEEREGLFILKLEVDDTKLVENKIKLGFTTIIESGLLITRYNSITHYNSQKEFIIDMTADEVSTEANRGRDPQFHTQFLADRPLCTKINCPDFNLLWSPDNSLSSYPNKFLNNIGSSAKVENPNDSNIKNNMQDRSFRL